VRWPCVFRHPIIRESVNPQLHRIDPATPYAAFQKVFRSEHCATLNPYGSESCPYSKEDCALAYLRDAQHTLWNANPKTRIGYFRKITRSSAAKRADEKPLARDMISTNGQKNAAGVVGSGAPEGRAVPTRRLRSIGSLFGKDDS
jgi:hypothetical protein